MTAIFERNRGRNYRNAQGREVYFRTQNAELLKRKQGQFGCGPEGWTCCDCAKPEDKCVCAPLLFVSDVGEELASYQEPSQ